MAHVPPPGTADIPPSLEPPLRIRQLKGHIECLVNACTNARRDRDHDGLHYLLEMKAELKAELDQAYIATNAYTCITVPFNPYLVFHPSKQRSP